MNNLFKYGLIFSLVLIVSACGGGNTGPAGPPGTDGTNGTNGTNSSSGSNSSGGSNSSSLAPPVPVLYTFGSSSGDALAPIALVKGLDGYLYGVTQRGGANGNGAVFKISTSGVETVIYSFGTNPDDGAGPTPMSLIQGSDGNLYGLSSYGGAHNYGFVFKVSTAGVESVIYSFDYYTNLGAYFTLGTKLTQGSDGYLYGNTEGGGSNGLGTIFQISTAGSAKVITNKTTSITDSYRNSFLMASDGFLYSTSLDSGRGGTHAIGAVYKTNITTGVDTLLYSFGTNPNDGAAPRGGLIQGSDGYLYGITQSGGMYNQGTVFKLSTTGVETVLYSFGANPGAGNSPSFGLMQGSDGYLYGTTNNVGIDNNYATIFKISTSGVYSTIYSTAWGTSGINPSSLLQTSDGYIYGVTNDGGAYNAGTVFKFKAP